jgi:hypothetical protein
VHAVELGAQAQDRLGVQLAHSGLGHAENGADLLQREAFVVVQRDDRALSLGELLNCRREDVFDLGGLEDSNRILSRVITDGADRVLALVAFPAHPEFLE